MSRQKFYGLGGLAHLEQLAVPDISAAAPAQSSAVNLLADLAGFGLPGRSLVRTYLLFSMLHKSVSVSLTACFALQQYVDPQLCLQTPAFLAAVLDQLQQPRSTTDAGYWIPIERYLLLVQVRSIRNIRIKRKARERRAPSRMTIS